MSKSVRLNMIFYGRHDGVSVSRITGVRPEYLIDNTTHGLWGEVSGYQNHGLLRDVAVFKEAGIKVIGYITAGYEGTGSGGGLPREFYTLEMNKKLITSMALLDGVDGVFIDECSQYPGKRAKSYLKELTELAHSYGLITWGNPGEDSFDMWYFSEGGFDIMHSTEQWRGQSLSYVQRKYGNRISVSGFSLLYTAEDAVRLTLDAWGKGIGYCYICGNGYNSIPSWFEEYAAGLQGYRVGKVQGRL